MQTGKQITKEGTFIAIELIINYPCLCLPINLPYLQVQMMKNLPEYNLLTTDDKHEEVW